ncbi:hypothetical protein ACIQ9P_22415 [Kitasatospora sp. NPDC094019]|uniref:hypothetical protein n=1 Tax=Kitasatospora sp. NPDC094019 TaxID=3364091 RepID=UPI003801B9FC
MARSAVVTVAMAALVGGLTACGGAGGDGSGGPSPAAAAPGGAVPGGAGTTRKAAAADPEAALAASAEVMRKASSARYTLSSSGGPDADPGTGFANWATGPAAIEYLTDVPNAPIRVRVVGNEAYMGPTEQAAAGVGEQVFWVKSPFLMWRRPFYSQLAMAMDPVNQLTLAGTSRPSTVGTETLDGAELTHYRAVADVAAVVGAIPGLTEEHRPHVEAALRKSGETFTLDFWLNAEQELVRFREFGANDGEDGAVTVAYSALGTAPTMTAPAPDSLRKSPDLDRFFPPSRAVTGPGTEAT